MSNDLIKSNKLSGPAGFPFLLIPFPQPIPRAFGIDSTSGPYGVMIQFRGTKDEKLRIQQAAELFGMTGGELMRRLCVSVADYLSENYKEMSK